MLLLLYPGAGRNRAGTGAGTTGQTGRRPDYGTGASSGFSSQGGFPVTGSGVSAAPTGRDSASDSAGYGSSGRSQQGYDAQAQGYAGGQGYTGTDNNRGGPQTSQTGSGGQSTGVGGSGLGSEFRAGPTGGNYGGPQTDQSTYGTGTGSGSRN